MNKILVLLSTYNGEKYLEEQLESLLSQKEVNLDILVRDDGSQDRTIEILEKWEKRGLLDWYKGENLKPAKSFMDLVYIASNYDYYAYCDQDDVWDQDKLKIAIQKLKQFPDDTENLYCSTLRIVDENLNFLAVKNINRLYSLGEAMLRNNVVGCTMVFNRKLLESLRKYNPNYIEMHDSWTYKVCVAINGNVIIDHEPHISYRQHSSNVIGASSGIIYRFRERVKKIFYRCNYGCSETARELLIGYSSMMAYNDIKILRSLIDYKQNFKKKIELIKVRDFRAGRYYQNLLFIIDVLVGNI